MKEQLMKEIQQKMSNALNDRQREQLKAVLCQCLRGYSVSVVNDTQNEDALENGRLLDLFLAAKRVEGCSEKTLHYYGETIRRMFGIVKLNVRDIFTENLRIYLGKYQEENKVSRVTIDNVRRILSSFFAWL